MILFRSARPQPLPPEALIEAVEALHREVDDAAGRVASAHGERLNCQRGCHQCCVDDLTVFEVEAEVIRARAGEVLTQIPHPPGACALLDEGGACRIYDHRPYVCRTQGLPLRWIEGDEDGDEDGGAVEYRDICPLNEEGPPLDILGEADCFTLGPFEAQLAALQIRQTGGELRRIGLRELLVTTAR